MECRKSAGKFLLVSIACVCCLIEYAGAATYTLTTAGRTAAQTPANWNTGGVGGGGTTASNFTTLGDIFIIASGTAATFGANTTFGTGVTFRVDGSFTISGNGVSVTINGTVNFTVTGSTQVTLAGAGSGNSFILGAAGLLQTANSNGISGTNCSLPVTAVKKTVTLPATASYELNGAAQSMAGLPATVNNFTLSGSGIKTWGTTLTTVSGNLTLSGTVSTTTTTGVTIGGDLLIGDGCTFTAEGFNLTVTGITTVGGGASGAMVISSATGTKTFGGLVTIANNATWSNSGNAALGFSGGITSIPTFNGGSGTHTFSNNSQALTGTFSIPNITITAITLANNNTLTVTTQLTGTGTLQQAASAVLNIGGTLSLAALTATAGNNVVDFNANGNQTIPAFTYEILNASTGGTKFITAGNTVTCRSINIANNVTVDINTDGGARLVVLD